MIEFKSSESYKQFARNVRINNRFIRNDETEGFLETVLATAKDRKKTIKKQSSLWRAQVGSDSVDEEFYDEEDRHIGTGKVQCPYPAERMKPLKDKASEGRANPKGIPYLYGSTDRETAMAEVRPWLGSLISVGQFKIRRNITLVNCASDFRRSVALDLGEPSPEEIQEAVWYDIASSFSKPVTKSDRTADYVPTQIIAELFKNDGLDGIVYKSALGKGDNVVLFDLNIAEPINCLLYEVEAVSFNFEKFQSPHFYRKYHKHQK
jgi:hypothetical protein